MVFQHAGCQLVFGQKEGIIAYKHAIHNFLFVFWRVGRRLSTTTLSKHYSAIHTNVQHRSIWKSKKMFQHSKPQYIADYAALFVDFSSQKAAVPPPDPPFSEHKKTKLRRFERLVYAGQAH
uniref:Uncharacterized protein n=1 Tax=Eutreptiella gymnastica TaxID=73025 RepID=A0A7S1I2Q8_9EUGL